MREVRFDYDEPVTVTEHEYLLIIESICEAIYTGANMLIGSLQSGLPNMLHVVTPEFLENHQKLARGISEIEDNQLRELVEGLNSQVLNLWKLAEELVSIVAQFFKVPVPTSKTERRKLHNKINKYWLNPEKSWKRELAYKELAEKAQQIYNEAILTKEQIDTRITQLLLTVDEMNREGGDRVAQWVLSGSAPPQDMIQPRNWVPNTEEFRSEFNIGSVGPIVQEADDLIDEAVEQVDPREALKLLRRALYHNSQGDQAGSIYALIGMKHEEMGNRGWAIRYYTKALETVVHPWPMINFKRGSIYYRRHEWDRAKEDFAQALSGRSFTGPEREQAEIYLSQISESQK